MNAHCEHCVSGPTGETGHQALAYYVAGPYPGHSIFHCTLCHERWIRHYGFVERFAWTRYATQFPIRKPRTEPVRPRAITP